MIPPNLFLSRLEARTIPAATWAVFTSVDPMPHSIQKVWQRIFQEWFPASNYDHSGGPELEVYTMGDTHAEDTAVKYGFRL